MVSEIKWWLIILFLVCIVLSQVRFLIILQQFHILFDSCCFRIYCPQKTICLGEALFLMTLTCVLVRNLESASHLFLKCNFFGSMWHLVWNWLGFSSIDSTCIFDQLLQFGNLVLVSWSRCSLCFWYSLFVFGLSKRRGTTIFLITK